MSNEIRVRFAPSPTGPFHIGGARSALFNCVSRILTLSVPAANLKRISRLP